MKELTLLKRIRYALEFAPIVFLEFILKLLGYKLALKTGAALARGVGRLLSSRQHIARQNIVQTLGTVSESEITKIIQGCWHNLGLTVVEMVYRYDFKPENYFKEVELENVEEFLQAQKQGGVIALTGHFGAWELGGMMFAFLDCPASFVARRIKNPYVDSWVNKRRSAFGSQIIFSRDAVRQSIQQLKRGNVVAMLIDHRVTQGSALLPFLGKHAHTSLLPALLALRLKVPVFTFEGLRLDDSQNPRVKIKIKKIEGLDHLEPTEEGIKEASLIFNRVFEDWVRANPEQWLWIHNRWKQ